MDRKDILTSNIVVEIDEVEEMKSSIYDTVIMLRVEANRIDRVACDVAERYRQTAERLERAYYLYFGTEMEAMWVN